MLRKPTRLIAASLMAVGALSFGVPNGAVAMSPCQARSLFSTAEFGQTVAVAGAYTTSGATDVWLTCGVVKNGVTIARFSDKQSGPVAVVEGTTNAGYGTFFVCYDLDVTYLDRPPTSSHLCP